MRKTLPDLAVYLKKIIVPETQESYTINSIFENILAEDDIKDGVFGFRTFLYRLCDVLIDKGDLYDKHKKIAHDYENRTTLSVYYPFLHNVKTLLMNIGLHGDFTESIQYLICNNNIFNEKLSVVKNIECLQFLTVCGVQIDGIDLDEKKQILSNIKTIKISYPDNPAMLAGLKIMAIAEKDHGTLDNQDIFLRCDYRILKSTETDVVSIVRDTIKTLPAAVQDFIIQLHRHYTDKSLKCTVEIKGFWIYIKYAYKRKDLWGINASLNNGFHMNIKSQNMDRYTDTIETFPPILKEIIAKGYGCGRKRETIGHCDGGCRGMIIPLDDSILDINDSIKTWLDQELSCL